MKEVYYFDTVLANSFAFLFPVFLINYFATGKFLLKRILGSYDPSYEQRDKLMRFIVRHNRHHRGHGVSRSSYVTLSKN